MAYQPPNGPPSYGYPHPPEVPPGAFTYVPAVMMPTYPHHAPTPSQPTYVTNITYPQQPLPEPVHVVESPVHTASIPMIDWIPTTPASAASLYGRAYIAGREGWDSSPLWIIRAHHNGNLVPGKLAIKHKSAYIPFGGKEIPVHNFEVLCAPSNMVQWVESSHGQVPPNAVIAGNTHVAEPLYIGRVRHRGSYTPGKIHPSHRSCYISFSGSEIPFKQYEVLVELPIGTAR